MSAVRRVAFFLFLAAAAPLAALAPLLDCAASDANLAQLRAVVCRSLVQSAVPWCSYFPNTTAQEDWPNQAVYLQDVLIALASPDTCLNTSTARDVVAWLSSSQADPTVSGAFMNTWVVFQSQYYDMPREAGARIESPDTLGRKCWAFAYLAQMWRAVSPALASALSAAGLSAAAYSQAVDAAIPQTMALCEEVMANCFVNASYNPARNGTCPGDIFLFHYLGFDRENVLRGGVVSYPFF